MELLPHKPTGRDDEFVSNVSIGDIAVGEEPSRPSVSKMGFVPGARTAWPSHPLGQALHLIDRADLVGLVVRDMLASRGRIPRVEISNGPFAVDLTSLLASHIPSPPRSLSGTGIEKVWDELIDALRPYRNVIDHLDGRLNFNVFAGEATALMIRLRIVDGAVDIQRLAVAINASLPYHSTAFVSLDFVVNGCDLELWLRTPSLPILIPAAPQIALPDVRVMSWHLTSGEVRFVRDHQLLPLWRCLHPDSTDRAWVAEKIATGRCAPSASLSIGSIDADLSLVNRNQIELSLGGANEIVLAPNAVVHLKAAGGIRGRTASGSDLPGAIELISIDRATVARLHLAFGSRTIDTDSIEIRELTDTRLTVSGLMPQMLTGRITGATSDNIRWRVTRSPRGTYDSPHAQPTAADRTSGSTRGSGNGRPRGGARRRTRGAGP